MNDNFKGIWIPAEVWLLEDLLLLEKVFLCKIYGLCNGSGCFASNKYFADFFGVSKSRCTQIIKKLSEQKYISVKLERKGKLVAKRIVNVLNKGGKLFKEGSKYTKQGGKEIKQGCLIHSEYNNTEDNNKEEEIKESISPYLSEFQEIKAGGQTRTTQLDKNFHFGLFEKHWSEEFQDSILGMWRYLEGREHKPEYWGNVGTINSQLSVIRSSLNQFSEQEIMKGFEACKFASKKSWHMYIKKGEEPKKDTSNYTPPYEIPTFEHPNKRNMFFYTRISEYHNQNLLDEYLFNTEYKKRGLYKKDAESLCYELEQDNPKLSQIQIKFRV